jgi:hypothetical protein
MRVRTEKKPWAVPVLALAALSLNPAAGLAAVPVLYPPPVLTEVAINIGPGDQYNPHLSGDWASYTGDHAIRYYRFSTGTDAGIPMGSSFSDLLSGISGSRIVFSRIIPAVKTAVMVFDAATAAAPIEIDPALGTTRLWSAIGGDTIAYIDYGLHLNGEMVIHDLATSTSVRITNDTEFDVNPAVSPAGNVVVWEHCTSSFHNCDIWQAVRTGPVWHVTAAADSLDMEANPDSNGSLVVYDSLRASNADIFWRPVAGGAEMRLQLPGVEANPSIAGDFILFESRPSLLATSDIFVYDTVNNRLFQITDTPLLTEQLNDIAVLADGSIRVVWSSDEDGFDLRNVRAATFQLPNVAPTLAHSTEPGYGTDGVSPDSGSTTTAFVYKAVYSDYEDQAPSYVDVCIDGTCHGMAVDTAAAAPLRDGDYRNGEQFVYTTTLAVGNHAYHFEVSDGADRARLPAARDLNGPLVTAAIPEISIDDVAVTEGHSGFKNLVFTVSLSAPSDQPVTVWYLTWPGTALAYADYMPDLRRITIAAHQLRVAVAIKVRGERLAESDETFYAVLFAPQGGVIADAIGQGTIVDDDF